MQPSGRAFEGVRTPRNVYQIAFKTSGCQSNIVRTLGQASLISTQNWISVVNTIWEFLQDVWTLSSISEYSNVMFEHGNEL
jgi:hypothetical protein